MEDVLCEGTEDNSYDWVRITVNALYTSRHNFGASVQIETGQGKKNLGRFVLSHDFYKFVSLKLEIASVYNPAQAQVHEQTKYPATLKIMTKRGTIC